ncbi:MAG: hypothetical protein IJB01_02280 [Bacteroidaceae bacterium]|nr:hypothetical protein [Bacteroidaceae bacterium]
MKKRTLFLAMMLLTTPILPIACSSEGNTAQQEEKQEKKETLENLQGEDKEYAQILKDLMTDETVAAAMNMSMKETEDALVQMLTANGIERSEAEAKVDRFVNEIMVDLNIKHFLPYCKKHLTMQELKEVKEIYNNKEYQKLNSMTLEAQKKNMRHLEALMSQAVLSIMSGEAPEPVDRNAGYSDRYMSLCKECLEVTNADMLVDNVLSQMSMAMGGNEESNKAIEALGKYFKENFATMYANMYYGTLNEEDLEKVIGYTKKPAMQKFMQANLERSKNLEGYINDVNSKVNEFITENTK